MTFCCVDRNDLSTGAVCSPARTRAAPDGCVQSPGPTAARSQAVILRPILALSAPNSIAMKTDLPLVQTLTVLQDPRLIAQIAMGQFADVSGDVNRTVTHLLLNDRFALGYVIGFAEQASTRAQYENDQPDGVAYVPDVISNMLGNLSLAATFMSFAASQKNDRTFQGGYEVGMGDLNAWCTSRGARRPSGLFEYLAPAASVDSMNHLGCVEGEATGTRST